MAAALEIISDPAAMTITVGPKVFDMPTLGRYQEKFTHIKEQVVGPLGGEDVDLRAMYQRYTLLLGPKFNRRFQAANYWLWIGNRMSERVGNMLRCEGRHWKQYNDALVWDAHQALPYVNEAERDGLTHIVPAIVAFGASPQEIKRRIGQGAWRRVAANSLTRNVKIMNAARRRRGGLDLDTTFVRLLDVPSGVMRAMQLSDDDEFIAARLTHLKRVPDFTETLHLVRDTMHMTGDDFNSRWSLGRMVSEHNKAIREINRKSYSDKQFAAPWSFHRDGYTAALLTSQLDIATEGSTQRHCVGSYASSAARGDYVVMRIDGKERATAGLRKMGRSWRIDQVYAAFNQAVSVDCMAFVRLALDEYANPAQERAA